MTIPTNLEDINFNKLSSNVKPDTNEDLVLKIVIRRNIFYIRKETAFEICDWAFSNLKYPEQLVLELLDDKPLSEECDDTLEYPLTKELIYNMKYGTLKDTSVNLIFGYFFDADDALMFKLSWM